MSSSPPATARSSIYTPKFALSRRTGRSLRSKAMQVRQTAGMVISLCDFDALTTASQNHPQALALALPKGAGGKHRD